MCGWKEEQLTVPGCALIRKRSSECVDGCSDQREAENVLMCLRIGCLLLNVPATG